MHLVLCYAQHFEKKKKELVGVANCITVSVRHMSNIFQYTSCTICCTTVIHITHDTMLI